MTPGRSLDPDRRGDHVGDRDRIRLHHPDLRRRRSSSRAGGRPARSRRRDGPRGGARSSTSRAGPSSRSTTTAASRRPWTLASASAATWRPRRIEEVRAPAGHPGPEVRADRAEDDHGPAGHVLAAVRTDALDDRLGARVADGEAHARSTHEVEPAARGAVQDGVPGDRLAARRGREIRLGHDRHRPARQPLADVVVGLADELERDARAGERAERLAGRALELEMDRTAQLAALEGAGQRRTERAVRGGDDGGPPP